MGLSANRNASALARSCASAAAAENTAARTIRTGSAFTAAETSHGNPAENLLAARLCLSDRLWLSWRASGFCEKQQPDWLQYYLQSWRGLFAAADAHTAASLFGMEYLTLAAAATLLFLMGFSALGPVLIFLFTMFYGLGNGTLFVQLLSDTALKRETWLLLLAFLPAAAASAGLCTLGTDSLRVSSQIRVCSFFAAGPDREIVRPHGFIRQYLLTLTLFVPLCGISAALASIGSRL